jgi:hypothetical protein
MTRYQLSHENWVTKQPDDVRFSVGSADSQNPDYLEYMAWLAAGNIPDPPSAEHRAIIRERLNAARRAARTAAETSGFVYNGHPFDSDRDSILRIANAATTALTATLLEAPFATAWHCADGYDMPLDAAGVMAMQGALAAHGQACHDRSSVLRALIEDPEADLDALADEIKTGWPG